MLSSNTLWGKIITICQGRQTFVIFHLIFVCVEPTLLNFIISECDDGVQSSDQFVRQWNEIKPTLDKDNPKSKRNSCLNVINAPYALFFQDPQ